MTIIESAESVLAWPGKSPICDGGPCHPALFHMLDVASVAEILLDDCMMEFGNAVREALCLLVALHDIGKFNDRFRDMLLHGSAQGKWRHWEVSEAYLWSEQIETVLARHLQCGFRVLRPLTSAVAGHHGRPAAITANDGLAEPGDRAGIRAGLDAATECVAAFCAIWPGASLAGLPLARAQALSWWLSGLTVAADWIGSNPDWFAPTRPPPGESLLDIVGNYRELARQRARLAVAEAGIVAPAPVAATVFDFALRPMQQAACAIPLHDGAMLAVIEDETGAGKTEAAVLLAQRMLVAGKAKGVYFALPTMATADAMFGRMLAVIGRLFAAAPTLALAHGRAALSQTFRALRDRPRASDDVVGGEWIGDDRRRALLANIGIGTIDQALLAVLPTRFATLRAWGLASKLLIVDEVHELGEPYIQQELCTLLRMHAANGGSAILITATLPRQLRQRLADAFAAGAGREPTPDASPAYPSLAIAGGAAIRNFPQAVGPRGVVSVDRLADMDGACAVLVDAVGRGAACVWVRNSVDDAIAAVEALRTRGIAAELLHARFALADRKRIEARLHARFGPDGRDRLDLNGQGRVLVGTQVLESSLDLDFDVMVSDLAPMAALIQRAGRLWRHMQVRPACMRPVAGPILHVLSPDPAAVESDRWLHALQPGGAWVYPVADQWRTADLLFRVGRIVAPAQLRSLIDAVHGDALVDLPDCLLAAESRALGEEHSKAGLARQNCVALEKGYRGGGGGDDDRTYPTRLGQETRSLLLVQRRGAELEPWADRDGEQRSRRDAEALSEVTIGVARIRGLPLPDQGQPEIVDFMRNWPEWQKASITVCPVAPDGLLCEGLRYQDDLGLIVDRRTSGDGP